MKLQLKQSVWTNIGTNNDHILVKWLGGTVFDAHHNKGSKFVTLISNDTSMLITKEIANAFYIKVG